MSYRDFLDAKMRRVPEAGRSVQLRDVNRVLHPFQRAVGCELKPSYWRTAVNNLRDLDAHLEVPTLFGDTA